MQIEKLHINAQLILVLRLLLGAVFIASGMSKYPDRQRFALLVVAFDVLPRRLAQLYGNWLPWIEMLVGVLLVLGLTTGLTAVVSAMLLVSFTAAIALNLLRGRNDVGCGCFGTRGPHRIGAKLLARNTILLFLSGVVLLGAPGSPAIDQALAGLSVSASLFVRGLMVASSSVVALILALPLVTRAIRVLRA